MRATRSSKYSQTPLNKISVRAGRTVRVGEAEVGLPSWGEIKGIGIQAVGTGGWSTQ